VTDWTPIKFPHIATPGAYLRIEGGRYIVLQQSDGNVRFENYYELKEFVEQRLAK
jgi:hypothetical protein